MIRNLVQVVSLRDFRTTFDFLNVFLFRWRCSLFVPRRIHRSKFTIYCHSKLTAIECTKISFFEVFHWFDHKYDPISHNMTPKSYTNNMNYLQISYVDNLRKESSIIITGNTCSSFWCQFNLHTQRNNRYDLGEGQGNCKAAIRLYERFLNCRRNLTRVTIRRCKVRWKKLNKMQLSFRNGINRHIRKRYF